MGKWLKIGRAMDLLFGVTLSEKIKMTINIWVHDWSMMPVPMSYEEHKIFFDIDERMLQRTFEDLPPESYREIKDFLYFRQRLAMPEETYNFYFYNWHRMAPGSQKGRKRYYRELKKYKYCSKAGLGEAESILYHHGLKDLPQEVLQYIKGGTFCDVGGCYGDSALVFFQHYSPQKVVTFEPGGDNRKIYTENMQKNGIAPEQYTLLPCGLGAEQKTVYCKNEQGGGNSLAEPGEFAIEVKTLDTVCQEEKIANVKVIKADIEGMGLQMLLGSEATIRRERPVLLLSIYHNQEEFFGIYKKLKEWNLDYSISIRHCHYLPGRELTLIGFPREILKEMV